MLFLTYVYYIFIMFSTILVVARLARWTQRNETWISGPDVVRLRLSVAALVYVGKCRAGVLSWFCLIVIGELEPIYKKRTLIRWKKRKNMKKKKSWAQKTTAFVWAQCGSYPMCEWKVAVMGSWQSSGEETKWWLSFKLMWSSTSRGEVRSDPWTTDKHRPS